MRKLSQLFILTGLIVISSAMARPAPLPDGVKEIRAVLEAQTVAWNSGNLDGYMNGYARDRSTEMISGENITRGWKAVRNRYRKKFGNRQLMGHVSFPEVHITLLSSDSATAVGQWKVQRASDQLHGSFSLLLRRRPEGWRIVRDYTTTITP